MNRTSFQLIAAMALIGIVTIGRATFAQEVQPCDTARVTYSPFDEEFAANITVQPGPAPRSALIMGDKQFTSQGTRWMIVSRPDYIKAGPWATVIWIGDRRATSLLQLAFLDHASGGVEVHLLNEKLLYGSVWWGRIVSTDFVFDVDRKAFTYREMANYGELMRPCQ